MASSPEDEADSPRKRVMGGAGKQDAEGAAPTEHTQKDLLEAPQPLLGCSGDAGGTGGGGTLVTLNPKDRWAVAIQGYGSRGVAIRSRVEKKVRGAAEQAEDLRNFTRNLMLGGEGEELTAADFWDTERVQQLFQSIELGAVARGALEAVTAGENLAEVDFNFLPPILRDAFCRISESYNTPPSVVYVLYAGELLFQCRNKEGRLPLKQNWDASQGSLVTLLVGQSGAGKEQGLKFLEDLIEATHYSDAATTTVDSEMTQASLTGACENGGRLRLMIAEMSSCFAPPSAAPTGLHEQVLCNMLDYKIVGRHLKKKEEGDETNGKTHFVGGKADATGCLGVQPALLHTVLGHGSNGRSRLVRYVVAKKKKPLESKLLEASEDVKFLGSIISYARENFARQVVSRQTPLLTQLLVSRTNS